MSTLPTSVTGRTKVQHRSDHEELHRLHNILTVLETSQILNEEEGDLLYRRIDTALLDADIPAGIARDTEVTAAIDAHDADQTVHGVDLSKFAPTVITNANASGALTIDCANNTRTLALITLTGDVTSMDIQNLPVGGFIWMRLEQGGAGSFTVVWDTEVLWSRGLSAPTLVTDATKYDIVTGFRSTASIIDLQHVGTGGGDGDHTRDELLAILDLTAEDIANLETSISDHVAAHAAEEEGVHGTVAGTSNLLLVDSPDGTAKILKLRNQSNMGVGANHGDLIITSIDGFFPVV